MRTLLGLSLIFFLTYSAYGQDKCKVLLPGLDSLYIGKCKKGLANGKGEAWGEFHYAGKFKNGYPEGKGKAEYRDGSVYEGYWKKGLRHGEGTITREENGKTLSTHGLWENDQFKEIILPPPYKVITKRNIDRLRVYKEGGDRGVVMFHLNAAGGLASDKYEILLGGDSGSQIRNESRIGYEEVKFPFTGSVRYKAWNKLRTQQYEVLLEIRINEPGHWVVEIQN